MLIVKQNSTAPTKVLKRGAKPKIILLGHSWGSVLGVMIAQKHPEWLYPYVGVGQWVNKQKSEREGYEFALSAARAGNNFDRRSNEPVSRCVDDRSRCTS
jgi:pimeloyl-ACP methyl ester carboxylesterase